MQTAFLALVALLLAGCAAAPGPREPLGDLRTVDIPDYDSERGIAKAGAAIWPQYENDRETLYRTRSAMGFADRLTTPILIMHGGADDDIPISQSQRMDAELTRLGRKHKFIVFEDQKHVIGGRGAERDAATIAWFEGVRIELSQ